MVYFVVGTHIVNGQKSTTKSKLNNGVGNNGETPKELILDLER